MKIHKTRTALLSSSIKIYIKFLNLTYKTSTLIIKTLEDIINNDDAVPYKKSHYCFLSLQMLALIHLCYLIENTLNKIYMKQNTLSSLGIK